MHVHPPKTHSHHINKLIKSIIAIVKYYTLASRRFAPPTLGVASLHKYRYTLIHAVTGCTFVRGKMNKIKVKMLRKRCFDTNKAIRTNIIRIKNNNIDFMSTLQTNTI